VSNLAAFVVIQTLANGVDGVTEYAYAYIFFQLPYGLWTVSVMTAYTPEMATAWARGELAELRDRFSSGFRLLPIIILPMSIGLIALAHPIISAVLEHGSFDQASGDLTARTLIAFAAGLPAFSVYLYALRGFYALRDTRTPFMINLGENLANVVIALIVVDRFGVVGLAASFSAAYAIFSIVALLMLQRRVGKIFDRRTTVALIRQLAASLMMVAAFVVLLRMLHLPAIMQILVVGLAGLGVYLGSLLILRSEETELVVARFRRTGSRRSS
jgi:putative peptidoglycan lipid II flippase